MRLFKVCISEPRTWQADRRARAGAADSHMRAADTDRGRHAALAEVEANAGEDIDRAAESQAHTYFIPSVANPCLPPVYRRFPLGRLRFAAFSFALRRIHMCASIRSSIGRRFLAMTAKYG